ncbi:MAG: hypothetical protein Q9218_008054, partial [Villophora microphyllina]
MTDAEKRVKGNTSKQCQGYTIAEGGYDQAETDWQAHISRLREPEKRCPAFSTSEKPPLSYEPPAVSTYSNPIITDDSPPPYDGRRSSDRAPNEQTLDNRPIKKQKTSGPSEALDILQPNDDSTQHHLETSLGEHWGRLRSPRSLDKACGHLVSHCRPQSNGKNFKIGTPGLDYISIPSTDSDDDDEFDCKSLDQTLSQSLSQMSPAPGLQLCKEQADLVDTIISGENVFYTGSAGC